VLDVLFGGLKASSVAWMSFFDLKNIKTIFSCKFFHFLVNKTLDPDPELASV
jgi:vacuolar-type H+-ATPase subunit C/Vma6